MSKNAAVIINPNSQNGTCGKRFPAIKPLIEGILGDVKVLTTDGPWVAAELTRQALRDGADLIVSIGGDGTHNEVANGFFERGEPVKKEAALAIVPFGTGGDFRKSLGIDNSPKAAVIATAKNRTADIDLGLLEFIDNQGKRAIRHFVNITSAGLGGAVDKKVNESTKALGGKASFAIGTVKAMAGYKNQEITFSVDGGKKRTEKMANLVVANGMFFGGGMWIAPKAKLNDGLFDIVVMGDLKLKDFLVHGGKVYKGEHLKHPKFELMQGRKVVAEAKGDVFLDVDGEAPGKLPCTFTLSPRALKVIVGEEPALVEP